MSHCPASTANCLPRVRCPVVPQIEFGGAQWKTRIAREAKKAARLPLLRHLVLRRDTRSGLASSQHASSPRPCLPQPLLQGAIQPLPQTSSPASCQPPPWTLQTSLPARTRKASLKGTEASLTLLSPLSLNPPRRPQRWKPRRRHLLPNLCRSPWPHQLQSRFLHPFLSRHRHLHPLLPLQRHRHLHLRLLSGPFTSREPAAKHSWTAA